jgi:DNA-3-methyladenine glycosylase II
VLQPALTEADLPGAVAILAARDAGLAAVARRFGTPPLWAREPGFPTLVHLILEQQVSLASAQAAFDRLVVAVDPLTPGSFLALDDGRLLAIGFSRQKTRYARALALAVDTGELDLHELGAADDEEVDRRLTALPGIGPWTATIYRLMVLLRPDARPRHRPGPGAGRDARARGPAVTGRDACHRGGVAPVAGGRGTPAVAPLPFGSGRAARRTRVRQAVIVRR